MILVLPAPLHAARRPSTTNWGLLGALTLNFAAWAIILGAAL